MDDRLVVNVVAIVTALSAIAFPILYAFSTWDETALGRFLMSRSIAYAAILSLTVIFRFYKPEWQLEAYVFSFIILTITNIAVIRELWRINWGSRTKEKEVEDDRV